VLRLNWDSLRVRGAATRAVLNGVFEALGLHGEWIARPNVRANRTAEASAVSPS